MKLPKCMWCRPEVLTGIGKVCLVLGSICNEMYEDCVAFQKHTVESRKALMEAIDIKRKENVKNEIVKVMRPFALIAATTSAISDGIACNWSSACAWIVASLWIAISWINENDLIRSIVKYREAWYDANRIIVNIAFKVLKDRAINELWAERDWE